MLLLTSLMPPCSACLAKHGDRTGLSHIQTGSFVETYRPISHSPPRPPPLQRRADHRSCCLSHSSSLDKSAAQRTGFRRDGRTSGGRRTRRPWLARRCVKARLQRLIGNGRLPVVCCVVYVVRVWCGVGDACVSAYKSSQSVTNVHDMHGMDTDSFQLARTCGTTLAFYIHNRTYVFAAYAVEILLRSGACVFMA